MAKFISKLYLITFQKHVNIIIFTQAQHNPSLSSQANISVAEAVAGAANAKHWMQMQNSLRTSGGKNVDHPYPDIIFGKFFTPAQFQDFENLPEKSA